MKKKIYKYLVLISLILTNLSVRIQSHKLCALIFWLNIRKIKIIKSNSNKSKNILVFPKTGGYEDLLESYRNKNDNNLNFYVLPRFFLKKIFSHYFEKKYKRDYFTKAININKKNKKKAYIKFLIKTFFSLEKFIKIDGFISFNIFYYAEKHLEEVFRVLKKKYVILHKESTFTPIEELNAERMYKKYNEKSLAFRISVYSENQKKILINSKIAVKKQIYVNGCPRSDYAFGLRKIKPKKNIIVYYLLEKRRGSNLILSKVNINWTKLYYQTLNYLIEFAKNNKNIKIILKGKIGVHKKEHFDFNALPKNICFIEGRTGEKLLKDATVVIAFNSMTVFETIASNRNLIIPNFNNENKKRKRMMLKLSNTEHFINSKNQFFKKLNFYLNSRYLNKKLSDKDKQTLKYYLGVTNGNSGKKVKNFLKETFN